MKYILFFLASLSLTSCLTSRKATDFLERNGELPKVCADKYPPKDSIVVKDSVTIDTVFVGSDPVFDTVTAIINDTVVKTVVKTLPAKVITKTQVQVKEVYRENTARVVWLNNAVDSLISKGKECVSLAKKIQDSRDSWKKKARQRWWWIVALIVFAFRRQIIGGAGRVLRHWAG